MTKQGLRCTQSVSFYCRTSKQNKQGLAPLELSIVINGDRVFIQLPVKFYPKDFAKKRKPTEIENIINQYRVKVNESICDLMSQGLPVTTTTLRNYLKTGGTKTNTLTTLVAEFLNQTKKTTSVNVYRKYEMAMAVVVEVIGGDTEVTTINTGMCNRIYSTLKERFLTSTSFGYMTKIKCLFTYAVDNGLMRVNPCASIKLSKGTPNISFLTTDDLNKIKSLDLSDYPKLDKVKDLLLFQSSTGLAYADLARFCVDDVQVTNGVMVYTNNRQKTGIEFTTVILKDGIQVLDKYDGRLPIISNQKYNAYLKDIQKLAGISTTITTHLLRKTYATYLLNSGVNISAVSKALGHSNTTITQRCYAKTTNEFVVNEIAKIVQ